MENTADEIVLDKRVHAVYLCAYYKLHEKNPRLDIPTTDELREVYLAKGPDWLYDVFIDLFRKTRGNELPPKYTPLRGAKDAATYLRNRGISLARLPDRR